MSYVVRLARKDDCPGLGRVLVRATASAFEGLVPERCLDWSPEQSAANWTRNFKDDGTLKDGQSIYVADSEEDGIVGLAMWGEARPTDTVDKPIDEAYGYELLIIQVAPDWQRQGVGRQLVGRVAAVLADKGVSHLLVRVLIENPNRGFYERMGAVELAKGPFDWEGYETEEVIYGWEDVEGLVIG